MQDAKLEHSWIEVPDVSNVESKTSSIHNTIDFSSSERPYYRQQKRKLGYSEPSFETSDSENYDSNNSVKRNKGLTNNSIHQGEGYPIENLYGLTREIWLRVFINLPPASLACLLRVCRDFRQLLTITDSQSHENHSDDEPCLATPASIWQRCHENFAPSLPKPLNNQSEISMWQLIKGNRCQNCTQKFQLQTLTTSKEHWSAGPGDHCVRVLWPFQVRLCGPCLLKCTMKEKDILLDNSFPSFLLEGIPFILVFGTMDCMTELQFKETSLPIGLSTTKVFYRPHVDLIKRQYDSRRADDLFELQSWIDNLSRQRQQLNADASRWETWERRGVLARINSRVVKKFTHAQDQATKTSSVPEIWKTNNVRGNFRELKISPIVADDVGSPQASQSGRMPESKSAGSSFCGQSTELPSKSHSDQMIKYSRQRDIELRCLSLDPPLKPDILRHMISFTAALSIAKEMDDQQWGILKERLLAERPLAESQSRSLPRSNSSYRREGRSDPIRTGSVTVPMASHHSAKDEGQALNTEADVGFPTTSAGKDLNILQERLLHLADDIIDKRWGSARSLTKDSSFQFAADVLVSTRRAYYRNWLTDSEISGTEASQRPTLENMRWLFETRIKPFTENHQKEIFLCHRCENASKTFGFEAVVQHYAAKHTNKLSLGNIVVHWRAEWPEDPPFHPNPMLLKALAITNTTSGCEDPANRLAEDKTKVKQAVEGFSGPNNIRLEGFDKSEQSPLLNFDTCNEPHNAATFVTPRNRYAVDNSVMPSLSQSKESDHGYSGNKLDEATKFSQPMTSQYANHISATVNVPTTETFKVHQAEMAKLAREYWFATSGIRGLTGPLRIQIIIHHSCEQFLARFQLEPGVNMFLFGLNHEPSMRPLRGLYGFSCQACAMNHPSAVPISKRRQSSTLPHLLSHFMSAHAEYYGLDWRKDMIQLPPPSLMIDLLSAPGIDENKAFLLKSAFPRIFQNSSSSISAQGYAVQASPDSDTYRDSIHSNQVLTGANDRDIKDTSGARYGYATAVPLDPVAEDEYDPHRPAYIGRMVGVYHRDTIVPPEQTPRAAYGFQSKVQGSSDYDQLKNTGANRYLKDSQHSQRFSNPSPSNTSTEYMTNLISDNSSHRTHGQIASDKVIDDRSVPLYGNFELNGGRDHVLRYRLAENPETPEPELSKERMWALYRHSRMEPFQNVQYGQNFHEQAGSIGIMPTQSTSIVSTHTKNPARQDIDAQYTVDSRGTHFKGCHQFTQSIDEPFSIATGYSGGSRGSYKAVQIVPTYYPTCDSDYVKYANRKMIDKK